MISSLLPVGQCMLGPQPDDKPKREAEWFPAQLLWHPTSHSFLAKNDAHPSLLVWDPARIDPIWLCLLGLANRHQLLVLIQGYDYW